MNRRDFLRQSFGASALLCMGTALSPGADAPPEPEMVSGADKAIERLRKAQLTFQVQDDRGQPLPGSKVSVEQTAHAFLFGCNFFMFDRLRDAGLEEQYREKFAEVFNYATLGFYWAGYEVERGKPNYGYTDRVLEWTSKNGILCKGHPLVWDHPAGSPRWLPEDSGELAQLSTARVREIMGRFKGKLEVWDVVNEATHIPDKANKTRMAEWAGTMGAFDYTKMHLEVARAANPNATLLVNDYRLDPPYFALLEQLLKEKARLFDIVGIQSHMHDGPWSGRRLWDVCERYARLGLPLHFTEATMVSGERKGPGENWGETTLALEEQQAFAAESFYRFLFSHPAVEAITWWDFSDRGAWQRAAAGWLRKDMSSKPVYDRMRELIKRTWWTKAVGVTDEKGVWTGTAFYGSHKVVVELPNGRRQEQLVRAERQGPKHFVIRIT